MDVKEKAEEIFNLYWFTSLAITKKTAIRLSIIHVNGIMEALEDIELPMEQMELIRVDIDNYVKVKEVILAFNKK